MNEKTFTLAEIRNAFDELKSIMDYDIEPGAGDFQRFLVDDVATDVENILTGKTSLDQVQADYQKTAGPGVTYRIDRYGRTVWVKFSIIFDDEVAARKAFAQAQNEMGLPDLRLVSIDPDGTERVIAKDPSRPNGIGRIVR